MIFFASGKSFFFCPRIVKLYNINQWKTAPRVQFPFGADRKGTMRRCEDGLRCTSKNNKDTYFLCKSSTQFVTYTLCQFRPPLSLFIHAFFASLWIGGNPFRGFSLLLPGSSLPLSDPGILYGTLMAPKWLFALPKTRLPSPHSILATLPAAP